MENKISSYFFFYISCLYNKKRDKTKEPYILVFFLILTKREGGEFQSFVVTWGINAR